MRKIKTFCSLIIVIALFSSTFISCNSGIPGPQGEKGEKGDPGEAGLSAFEIFLKYHPDYSGTEEDWINSLYGHESSSETKDETPAEMTGEFKFAKNEDGKSYVLVSYSGLDRNVEVPSTYNGYPVTTIGTLAFAQKSIHVVKLPDTITEIEEDAFRGSSHLEQINLPNSITSIGQSAFSGCKSLTEISLPNELITLEPYVFADCINLSTIYIPTSVVEIKETSFGNCPKITDVHYAGNEEEWGLVYFGYLGHATQFNSAIFHYNSQP